MTNNAIDRIPEEAYTILNDIGIPSNLKGYNYLAYAIYLVADDPNKGQAITKVLYPEVAKSFSTKSSRVERAIRHAITHAFESVDKNLKYKYFGNSVDLVDGRPTNSHFIDALSRVLRRDLLSKES